MGYEHIHSCDKCGKKIAVDEDRYLLKHQTGTRTQSKDSPYWKQLTRKETKIATLCAACTPISK